MRVRFLLPTLVAFLSAHAEEPAGRPLHTYSIVARDSTTGDLGVAVQSHWFSVGALVPWAEAGVGAVATQSFVDPSYGPLGLELLRVGKTARQTLDALLAADPGRDVRQVAIVDAAGTVAAHTGARCIQGAGHVAGRGFSVQANLMLNDRIWGAMAAAFEKSPGDLAERMLAALEAGEAAGGYCGDGSRPPFSLSAVVPPAGRGRTGSSTCAWRTIPTPCRSCAASWESTGRMRG